MATKRTVTVANNGIRIVDVFYGDGECWHRYVVVPRKLIVEHVQNNPKSYVDYMGIFHGLISEFFDEYYYGGPGQPFVYSHFILYKNRHYYTFSQSGGYDV